MKSHSRQRRHFAVRATALALLLVPLCCPGDTPGPPTREEMLLNGIPVVVEYVKPASPQDLMLPRYPGAKLETSFSYTVSEKGGKRLLLYAAARLTTSDPPRQVAARYSEKLPGKPKPELLEDKSGTGYVLAIASDREVRQVTVTGRGKGSRIELIRATKPATPDRPRYLREPKDRIYLSY